MEDRNIPPPSEHDPTEDLPADFSPKERPYLHFDVPIPIQNLDGRRFDPAIIERHSFMPFLGFTITERRYRNKKREDGTKVKEVKFKSRDIRYASHADSLIYSYYSYILSVKYENYLIEYGIDHVVAAYRSGRGSNIDYAKEAFDWIRLQGNCTAIAIDVSKFFDNLNHDLLLDKWRWLLDCERIPSDHHKVFKSLTNYSYCESDALERALGRKLRTGAGFRICNAFEFRTRVRPRRENGARIICRNNASKGIPQGSPISGLLANIYMADFDFVVSRYTEWAGGKYIRYSDDICLLLPSHLDANGIVQSISKLIETIKLDIQPEKTEVSRFFSVEGKLSTDKPFQYLGFVFDGQRTLIRESSMNRYYSKMRAAIKAHGHGADRLKIPRIEKFQRLLFAKYTHLGQGRNFPRYAYRAAKKLNAPEIRRQIRGHMKIFLALLQQYGARASK